MWTLGIPLPLDDPQQQDRRMAETGAEVNRVGAIWTPAAWGEVIHLVVCFLASVAYLSQQVIAPFTTAGWPAELHTP